MMRYLLPGSAPVDRGIGCRTTVPERRSPGLVRHPLSVLGLLVLAGCAGSSRSTKPTPTPVGTPAGPSAPVAKIEVVPPAAAALAVQEVPPEAAPKVAQPPKPLLPPGTTLDEEAKRAFARGVAAAAREDWNGAQAAFADATSRDPGFGWAWYNLGVVRERRNDETGAGQAYRSALKKDPGFFPAADGLARLLVRTGRAAAAEQEFRTLSERKDALGARVALAWTLFERGKAAEAEKEAKRVLAEDERNARAMAVLASIYEGQRTLELAQMVLETARRIDPSDAVIVHRLARVKLALKDEEGALADFQEAAARTDFASAQLDYGAMLVKRERYEEAIPYLERATRLAPKEAVGHLDLGNAYRGTRRFDRALSEYREAQRLDPKLVDVLFALALLHLDGELPGTTTLDRLEASLSWFEKFQSAGGQDPMFEAYERDARKAIEREKRRLERDEKERDRKATAAPGGAGAGSQGSRKQCRGFAPAAG